MFYWIGFVMFWRVADIFCVFLKGFIDLVMSLSVCFLFLFGILKDPRLTALAADSSVAYVKYPDFGLLE